MANVAVQDARNAPLPPTEEGEGRQSRRIVVATVKCGKLFRVFLFCPDTGNRYPLMATVFPSNDLHCRFEPDRLGSAI